MRSIIRILLILHLSSLFLKLLKIMHLSNLSKNNVNLKIEINVNTDIISKIVLV